MYYLWFSIAIMSTVYLYMKNQYRILSDGENYFAVAQKKKNFISHLITKHSVYKTVNSGSWVKTNRSTTSHPETKERNALYFSTIIYRSLGKLLFFLVQEGVAEISLVFGKLPIFPLLV